MLQESPPSDIGVYILCGGLSSRMGQCKTTVEFDGKRMLQHLLDTLTPLSLPTHLICKPSQAESLRVYQQSILLDHTSLQHPLEGLRTALTHALEMGLGSLLILPCDTPFLSIESLSKMLNHCPSVAFDGQHLHPLVLHLPVQLDMGEFWLNRAQEYLLEQGSMKEFARCAEKVRISPTELLNINRLSDIPSHLSKR